MRQYSTLSYTPKAEKQYFYHFTHSFYLFSIISRCVPRFFPVEPRQFKSMGSITVIKKKQNRRESHNKQDRGDQNKSKKKMMVTGQLIYSLLMRKTGCASIQYLLNHNKMANFGEDVFDIHVPGDFVFPEPFYEEQSEEYYQPQSNSKNSQEKLQSCGEKQDIKTTDIAELVWNNSEEGAFRVDRNKGNVQLEFCPKIKQKGEKIKRGTKDDTMLLNINFKTILVSYFKQKVFLKELNQVEAREVQAFIKRQPSFKSLAVFCRKGVQGSTLRKQLLHLAQSDLIARRILESRCLLENKIQMLKFLQIFRRNVVDGGKITKWKDLLKK